MAKSRQRYTHPKIIDRPEFKSRIRHITEATLAASLWALWLYWISPIITLVLWLLGLQFFYQEVVSESRFYDLIEVLKNGGIVLLVIFLLQIVWIYYNYFAIFKRKGNRRRESRASNEEAIAKYFKMDADELKQAKKHNQVDFAWEGKEITITPRSS